MGRWKASSIVPDISMAGSSFSLLPCLLLILSKITARDGLGGITERHPELNTDSATTGHSWFQLTNKPGASIALDLIRSYPRRTVTYLVLGPLTNLATLLRLDPTTVHDRIGPVFCMGGALDVPGNTNPVSECECEFGCHPIPSLKCVAVNFFADPFAVKELLTPTEPGTGFPLDRFFLLPLDITTRHQLPFPFYKENVDPDFHSTVLPSKSDGKPPIVHFTSSFFEKTREVMMGFGSDAMELHDIVAVWCAIENSHILLQDLSVSSPLAKGWKAVKREFAVERCVRRHQLYDPD